MKRSEMILKIAESLTEPHFSDDPMKEADCILKRIETAGMQPPLGLDKSQIYPPGHKFHNPDFQGNLEHVWEPE